MKMILPGREIRVFTISPRTLDTTQYWQDIQHMIQWSDRYDCTGILIFTGNDTYIDPWIVAQTVLTETRQLSPLIAVNPVYMHPFTAAKMVSSFAYVWQRKVFLNMVTGTALSHLAALHDDLSHDERYLRLSEYIQLMQALLASPTPVTFSGQFYSCTNLQLLPPVPPQLRPEYLIAGSSEAALQIRAQTGAIGMQMLKPTLSRDLADDKAIHFGIVTRSETSEAWQAAQRHFPEDTLKQSMLDFSMNNTDSVWKRRLKIAADQPDKSDTGYWLAPFRNFMADCPYVVGDYQQVAELLANLIVQGIDCFVLDIPAHEEEFQHIHAAFALAKLMLAQRGKPAIALPAPEASNDELVALLEEVEHLSTDEIQRRLAQAEETFLR